MFIMFKLIYQNYILKINLDLTKRMIYKRPNIILRLCSTTINDDLTEWNNIKLNYSKKHLKFVLNTLNKCKTNEIKKYDISEDIMKILESISNENKSYKSLDDFIKHNLIQANQMDSICSTILKDYKKTKKTPLILPMTKQKDLSKFKTAVGLQLGINYISWSQLELTGTHCNLLKWDCRNVSELPLNAKLTDVIKTGIDIAQCIPNSDAYIMEKESSKPMAKISRPLLLLLMRQQQLTSTILTQLITREASNELCNDNPHKIYTMRASAPAQYFGLRFGHEVVSSTSVVQNLLSNNYPLKNISNLTLDNEIADYYASQAQVIKEEMNKSLLLTLTFFESLILE